MRKLVIAMIALVLVVAGCGPQTDEAAGSGATTTPGPEPTTPSPPTATGSETAALDPVDLIGLWSVGDVEEPGAVLRLDVHTLDVIRDCGLVSGDWQADSRGLFVATTFGGSGACADADGLAPEAPWLLEVVGFRAGPDGPVLVDRDGEDVVALLPAEAPAPPADVALQVVAPPQVDEATRQALRPSAPLPEELEPVGPTALRGRWEPTAVPGSTESPAAEAHVAFASDGTWSGSDGCNGQGGRWVSGPDAAVLFTSGPSTDMGCAGLVSVGALLSDTRSAGLDGDVLVLLDADGAEIGRLRPADR